MTSVSVIGLGPMGAALATKLLREGNLTTVWNRSREKAAPLISAGATHAPSLAAAVAASDVVVISITNYQTAHSLLNTGEVITAVHGKLLVQLSTGSPSEARAAEAWAHQCGAQYVDGAIWCYPAQIGTPESAILLSGEKSAYERGASVLASLSPNLMFVGEKVGAASTFDCAVLSCWIGALIGGIHGARICEAEGLRVDEYGTFVAEVMPTIGGDVKQTCEAIQAGEYANPEALLGTWATGLQRIAQQARDAQINAAFPDFVSSLLQKAVTAGYGGEGLAALIKSLRANPGMAS